jgi:hypothetical protein
MPVSRTVTPVRLRCARLLQTFPRIEELRPKKSRRDFSTAAIPFENYRCKSGFCFLRGLSGLLTLRFQLSELLRRKNSSGLFKECVPAFLCASCLHAFGLPRFDFCLLVGREIERCKISARHGIRLRDALGATRLVSCKGTGCRKHRNRNQSRSGNFNHGKASDRRDGDCVQTFLR